MIGLEPTRLTAPDPKSGAAANYATSACMLYKEWCKGKKFFLPEQVLSKQSASRTVSFPSTDAQMLPQAPALNGICGKQRLSQSHRRTPCHPTELQTEQQ